MWRAGRIEFKNITSSQETNCICCSGRIGAFRGCVALWLSDEERGTSSSWPWRECLLRTIFFTPLGFPPSLELLPPWMLTLLMFPTLSQMLFARHAETSLRIDFKFPSIFSPKPATMRKEAYIFLDNECSNNKLEGMCFSTPKNIQGWESSARQSRAVCLSRRRNRCIIITILLILTFYTTRVICWLFTTLLELIFLPHIACPVTPLNICFSQEFTCHVPQILTLLLLNSLLFLIIALYIFLPLNSKKWSFQMNDTQYANEEKFSELFKVVVSN